MERIRQMTDTRRCALLWAGDDIADGSIVVFVWGKSTCVGRG